MKKTLLAVTLGAAATVWADCPEGARNTTETEKQFYVRTMTAIKASIPPPPAGWRIEDRNFLTPPNSVCKGGDKEPMHVGYDVRYIWQDGIVELNRQTAEFDKTIVALRQLPPDKQKEFDVEGRRSRDLERQAIKLRATDKAEADRLSAESKEIWMKVRAIREAHEKSVLPQILALSDERSALLKSMKTEVHIHVLANPYGFVVPEGARKISTPGATVALECKDKIVVGFGAWSQHGSEYKTVYKAGPATRVQTMNVEAAGDPKHAQPLLAAMNTAALASLVGN